MEASIQLNRNYFPNMMNVGGGGGNPKLVIPLMIPEAIQCFRWNNLGVPFTCTVVLQMTFLYIFVPKQLGPMFF